METVGWLSIVPPIIAIALAIKTREVYISLGLFVWLGWTIMNSMNPIAGLIQSVEVFLAAAFLAAAIAWTGTHFIIPSSAALGLALLLGLWLWRRLGGLTGDIYGAAIELGEVVFLVVAVAGPMAVVEESL